MFSNIHSALKPFISILFHFHRISIHRFGSRRSTRVHHLEVSRSNSRTFSKGHPRVCGILHRSRQRAGFCAVCEADCFWNNQSQRHKPSKEMKLWSGAEMNNVPKAYRSLWMWTLLCLLPSWIGQLGVCFVFCVLFIVCFVFFLCLSMCVFIVFKYRIAFPLAFFLHFGI